MPASKTEPEKTSTPNKSKQGKPREKPVRKIKLDALPKR